MKHFSGLAQYVASKYHSGKLLIFECAKFLENTLCRQVVYGAVTFRATITFPWFVLIHCIVQNPLSQSQCFFMQKTQE